MSGTSILCLGSRRWLAFPPVATGSRFTRLPLGVCRPTNRSDPLSAPMAVWFTCDAGSIGDFDVILTRTMPAGSLEQITFRLADAASTGVGETHRRLVNPPRSLEIAIDKFATLAHVARLGYAVPETVVVQTRTEAVEAFRALGGDCVVKPVFGGEGRGVMRIRDEELAWYTFSTLHQLGAVIYIQRFVPPGGQRYPFVADRRFGVRNSANQCQGLSHQRGFAARIPKSLRTDPRTTASGDSDLPIDWPEICIG